MADSFPSTESFSPQLLRGSCGVKEEDLIPPTTQNTPDPSGEGERGFRQLAGRADSDWDDRRAICWESTWLSITQPVKGCLLMFGRLHTSSQVSFVSKGR